MFIDFDHFPLSEKKSKRIDAISNTNTSTNLLVTVIIIIIRTMKTIAPQQSYRYYYKFK